jgi:CDP-6-deoxy-D-xylo-4-hexulose-3-dehydrase
MNASPDFRRVGLGTADITGDDIARVTRVLESGRLSAGPFMAEFESRFAALHGCAHASMCNSGTGALQLALQALRERGGWPPGAEVIVPAVTFVATVNIVLFNGLTPVLVDVDPLTYTIDPDLFEAAITPRTVAVIPVHLFGQAADMTSIMTIARAHGLAVVEDSAETAFVTHAGRPVGSFGDFGCFSTYMAHLVTTGVGGLALTNDPDLAVRFRSLMNHGRNPAYLRIDDDENVSDERLLQIVWSRYDFVSLGQSFRATEMEAALGIGQLDRHEVMLDKRRAIAALLHAELDHPELMLPTVGAGNEHAYMMFPVMCRADGLRDRLMIALERAGVETRLMLPILGQTCYEGVLHAQAGEFPVAEHIGSHGFYIGSHHHLDAADVVHVGRVVREVIEGSR